MSDSGQGAQAWRKGRPYEAFSVGQEVRPISSPGVTGTVTEVRSWKGQVVVKIWESEGEYGIHHFLNDEVLIRDDGPINKYLQPGAGGQE